jgi:hypothetical protein
MPLRTHAPRPTRPPLPAATVVQRLPESRPFAPDRPRTLPGNVLQKMESAFGHDFSRVSIHEGERAASIGARAFAQGENLHFAPGAFRPHSAEGQKVLGHELAHVVQQRQRLVRPTARIGRHPLNADARLEAHADRAGEMAARGVSVTAPRTADAGPSSGGVVQGWFDNPWQVGAAVAGGLGLAYLGLNRLLRPQPRVPTMRIPNRTLEHYQTLKTQVRGSVGNNDPKVRWNDAARTMDTDYDGQQLIEQVPGFSWMTPGFDAENLDGTRRPMEAAFGSQALRTQRAQEEQGLLARTTATANHFNYNAVDARRTRSRIRREQSRIAQSPNATAGVLGVLRNHQGMVFGESHGSHENKQYISNNMAALAGTGVNTIYMEHFRPDHQQHIDDWLAGPAMAMHPELDRAVNSIDTHHGAQGAGSVRGILTAAKQHGVRVRAADTLAASTPANANGQGGPVRLATMNQFAMEQVQGDQRPGNGKYLMLVGRHHSNTQRGNPYAQGLGINGSVPGLSQMLNIPAVTIDPRTGRPRLDKETRANR